MADKDFQELHTILNNLFEDNHHQEGARHLWIKKIKSLLPRLLNTRLVDKNSVKAEEVNSTLEFILILSTRLPQVFTNETSSVCSVLFRLMPVMSEPKCKDIQPMLQQTVCSLLQLFYGYDITACKLFYEDSIVLLQDLLENLQNLYTKRDNVSELLGETTGSEYDDEGTFVSAYCTLARHNAFLKSDSAKKDEDDYMEDSDSQIESSKKEREDNSTIPITDFVFIDVSNVWRCTAAQVFVTNILAQAIKTNSVIKEIANIWFLVHTQIQYGQPLLKHASLCLLNVMLENYDFPKTNILDSLVSCVLGLLSSDLPQQYLSHFRNAEIDEALGVAIGKLYNQIPPATVFAFSSQLTLVLPTTLIYSNSDSLKMSLCKAFNKTLKACPTVATSVSLFLKFFDNEVIQPQIIECFNYVLSNVEERGERGEGQHKGKRRKLNLEIETGKIEEQQLLQEVLDIIDRTKPADFKDSPQKMISGVVTIDTALQICLDNYIICPSLDIAAKRLDEWIRALVSEMQNTNDTSYLRAASILVKLIGKILILAPPSFSEPMLSNFLSLLSIPWSRVPLFNPLHQEKLLLMKQLGTSSVSSDKSTPSSSISPKDYIISCLEVLAWLPPTHFVTERKQYFSYAIRSSEGTNKLLQEEGVRVQVICNLPLLLSRIGHEHVSEFVTKIGELLDNEKSPLVHEAVARFGGFLVCLSDPDNPIWKDSPEMPPILSDSSNSVPDSSMFFRSNIHSIEPVGFEVLDSTKIENQKCHVCDWHRFSPSLDTQNKQTTPTHTFPFQTWKTFLNLSSTSHSAEVRASFLFGTFLRILRHAAPYIQPDLEFFWDNYLTLVSDKVYNVRVAVARAISTFAASDPRRVVCQELLMRLKPMITDATLDPDVQKTAFILLGELGCVLEGDILLVVFVALLEGFAFVDLRPFVHDQIRYFTRKIGTTPKDLMKQFASEIYHALMLKLETSFSVVEEVCVMLNYSDTADLFKEALPHALPVLVFNHSEHVLQEIAKRTKLKVEYLCISHATEILLHMLMKTEQEDLPNQIVYLCEITRCTHRNLIEVGLTNLLYQLVVKLGNPSTNTQAIQALNSTYKMLKTEDSVASTDGFSDFMMENFLSLADKISLAYKKTGDAKHPNTLEQKENVLRSLEALVNLLAPHHLNSVRPKVMAILKSVIQRYPLLHPQACSVWYTFVRRLDISHLGPILSQIFVDLLPCIGGTGSDKAVAVFEYLVVQHRQELRSFFKEIPFLPDQDGPLREIAALVLAEQSSGVKAQITQILQTIQHESTDVRKMGLTKLKEILKVHRKEVNLLILSDVVDPVIHRLIKALLVGSRDAHHSLKLPYAECIGELGAIDPGRLGVIDLRPDDTWVEKDEMEMASELILVYLVKALNAATNATLQDRAAFAIQEVLKFAGCSIKVLTSTTKGKGKEFWNSLPEEKREIVKPYLNSKCIFVRKTKRKEKKKNFDQNLYMLHGTSTSSSNLNQSTGPVTIYQPNMSYTKWISAWTSSLLPKAQGPKLQLFLACRGVVKDDTRTAHYLLPYLLLHVLLNGEEEDRAGVLAEMLAVLNDCVGVGTTSPVKANSSESVQLCTQKVFHLIDWMNSWVETEVAAEFAEKNARTLTSASGRNAPKKRIASGYQKIENILADIPKILLASAAHKSLLYLETHLRKEMEPPPDKNPPEKREYRIDQNLKAELMQKHLGFLQRIYSGLDEPDGLEGCSAIRVDTSLEDRIIDHEHAGHWSEALACYDMALQASPNANNRLGILTCLKNLGHFDTMASLVQGALAAPSNYNSHNLSRIVSQGVQAAWRLGNWNLLEEFVSRIPDTSHSHHHNNSSASSPHIDFESAVGRILLHVRACVNAGNVAQTQTHALTHALSQCRVDLMASLGAASMESYQKSYPIIAKLHMLHELEQSSKLSNTVPPEFLADWESRLKITQPSFRIAEPILSFRRLIFGMHNARDELGRTWLQIGKAARISNQLQTAANAVMKASMAHTCSRLLSHLESAKLQSKMGNTHQALNELQDVLRRAKKIPEDANDKMLLAKTHILVGRWMKATGQVLHAEIIEHYEQSIKLCPSLEKGHFFLASYYDTFIANIPPQLASQSRTKQHIPRNHLKIYICYVRGAIRTFGNALKMGHNFLFQSLPRLLTIWFEFGTNFNHSNMTFYTAEYEAIMNAEAKELKQHSKKKPLMEKLNKIYNIIKDLRDSLPGYQWITCFPQLISRICHSTNEVWELLRSIIAKVLLEYPQQGLWTMIALSKSNQRNRQARAHEILQKTGDNNPPMARLQEEILQLVDKLVWICNENIPKPTGKDSMYSLEKEYQRKFHRSFHAKEKDRITPIIVPLGIALTATLPPSGRTEPGYQPFANNIPTINSFRDSFDILGSVQQPKKVTILDSSGKDNIFLCKPKDDLRKDARMMEVNNLINKLLKKDPKSRKRNLKIRTYAVTPLNEECGLIEWVNNTATFKSILTQLYKEAGIPPVFSGLKVVWQKKPSVETFTEKVLPHYPPKFHLWFVKVFRDPCSWFEARLAYCSTLAVMSMVGLVMGLGDRHGENILFDGKTGEAVHVDFNCLFWKGLTFEKPERVPFRLTQNLVDGMGLTGYEGSFKKVSEITLGLLRNNRDTLISVLHTFIYDPLVEWNKTKSPSGEHAHEEAVTIIKKIEKRLMGQPEEIGLPLSVEGHVYQQIQEATSAKNLSQMYIGWAPWL